MLAPKLIGIDLHALEVDDKPMTLCQQVTGFTFHKKTIRPFFHETLYPHYTET